MYHLLGKELGSPILSPPKIAKWGGYLKTPPFFWCFESAKSPHTARVFSVSQGMVFGVVKNFKKYHTNFIKIHIVKATWKKCFLA